MSWAFDDARTRLSMGLSPNPTPVSKIADVLERRLGLVLGAGTDPIEDMEDLARRVDVACRNLARGKANARADRAEMQAQQAGPGTIPVDAELPSNLPME